MQIIKRKIDDECINIDVNQMMIFHDSYQFIKNFMILGQNQLLIVNYYSKNLELKLD